MTAIPPISAVATGKLTRRMPQMRVLGGCCGTDHRHVAAICEACLPREAASA